MSVKTADLERWKVTVVMEDGETFHWDGWAEDKSHAFGLAHDFAQKRSDVQIDRDFGAKLY